MTSNVIPDVVAISETRIRSETVITRDNFKLNGYDFVHTPTLITAAGGSALYIRESLKFIERNDLCLKSHHCEDTWIELKLKDITGIV